MKPPSPQRCLLCYPEVGQHILTYEAIVSVQVISKGLFGVNASRHGQDVMQTVVPAYFPPPLQSPPKHAPLSPATHQSPKALKARGASVRIEKRHARRRNVEGTPVFSASVGRVGVGHDRCSSRGRCRKLVGGKDTQKDVSRFSVTAECSLKLAGPHFPQKSVITERARSI